MRAVSLLLIAGLSLLTTGTRADDPPKAAPPKVWEYGAHVEAVATAEVRARVTGYLTRIAVKEGAAVKKGELLAEIDPRYYAADVEVAKARLKLAEAKLQAARTNLTQTKTAFSKDAASADDLRIAEADAAATEAGVAVARAELERAELMLSWTRVTAPFDGRVGRFAVTEGNLVRADATRVVTVVATDPLFVAFDMDERTLLRLRRDGLAEPGKLAVAVGLADEEGYPHEAKLDLIDPQVDPAKATVRFRAVLPNPKGMLSPGMFVRVRLTPAPAR
jgi:RND family efflux transporter MFP subunit